MSDPDVDDDIPPEPDGEIVHWMAPKPLAIGPVGLSGAVAGTHRSSLQKICHVLQSMSRASARAA